MNKLSKKPPVGTPKTAAQGKLPMPPEASCKKDGPLSRSDAKKSIKMWK